MPLVSNRITSPSSRRHNLHKDNQVQQAEGNTSYFSQHQKGTFVFSPCVYNARRPFAVLAILDLVSLTLKLPYGRGINYLQSTDNQRERCQDHKPPTIGTEVDTTSRSAEWPKESRFARARRIHPELGLM
ncbi:hypothetical protein CABS01_03589 [Colletotrichum abscissum]|uniref:Uncharacterized protein n=1 Tax=Colletotrichum abscissum TaxID=1671311 RepID=A0A9Q0B8M9_9PEZI|nr:uncharacterized protein CABS01_03589 [Colletotrichum abscissum]KAI3559580.1 hypothetical protein CABS02_00555 [Colletotrichum abscissum]KAK1475312.1 hypothetical protein CABS01_03589 [Colletotrichum abscissum]